MAVDTTSGTLVAYGVAAMDDTRYPCIYFDTTVGGSYHTYPLQFDPENAEYYQIRLKLENFRIGTQVDSNGTEKTVQPSPGRSMRS